MLAWCGMYNFAKDSTNLFQAQLLSVCDPASLTGSKLDQELPSISISRDAGGPHSGGGSGAQGQGREELHLYSN